MNKIIPEFPNYILTKDGKVFNKKGSKLTPIKPKLRGNTPTVILYKEGKKYERSLLKLKEKLFPQRKKNQSYSPSFKDNNPLNLSPENLIYKDRIIKKERSDVELTNPAQAYNIAKNLLLNQGYSTKLDTNAHAFHNFSCDDIIQEIVMAIWTEKENLGEMTERYAWGIARNTLLNLYNKSESQSLKFENIGVEMDFQQSLRDDSENSELEFYIEVSPYINELTKLQYNFMRAIVLKDMDSNEAGKELRLTQKETQELVFSIQNILKKYKD